MASYLPPVVVAGLQVFPTSERINMSHIIHSFGFGVNYPGRINPLDGVKRIILPLAEGEVDDKNPHQIGTFKYFLKVPEENCTWQSEQK